MLVSNDRTRLPERKVFHMRQVQSLVQVQKLALTQSMRQSLAILSMGMDEACKVISMEISRNAFLTTVPTLYTNTNKFDVLDTRAKENEIDKVIKQIGLIRLSKRQRAIAEDLAHSLDDRGFLLENPIEMCKYLKCDLKELFKIVDKLQASIEPVGMFAWSLKECFKLQLVSKNRFDPIMEGLLKRLDLVAAQDIDTICDEFGVEQADAIEMLNDIRSLNPDPLGRNMEFIPTGSSAELIIKNAIDGELVAEINPKTMPQILVDDAMFSTAMAVETDLGAISYYKDCYKGAANMVRAMQKRANTLLRTCQAIADKQQKFIRTGRDRDKVALTMSRLANYVGVNKSTICRALSHCKIETSLGVYPAHHFLARGIKIGEGNKTRDQCMYKLNILLKTENKNNPFSDEEIAVILKKMGFPISRRTIAKYRKNLGFPGAYERHKRDLCYRH